MSKSFKHVSNTWLVALVIHPVAFYIYVYIVDQGWMEPDYILAVIVFGFVFSICGYLLCVFLFNLLFWLDVSRTWKFFVWIMIMNLCIAAGTLLTCLFFVDYNFFNINKDCLIPAMVSSIISACLRLRQFASTVELINTDSLIT